MGDRDPHVQIGAGQTVFLFGAGTADGDGAIDLAAIDLFHVRAGERPHRRFDDDPIEIDFAQGSSSNTGIDTPATFPPLQLLSTRSASRRTSAEASVGNKGVH